jgi:hypothetical protein
MEPQTEGRARLAQEHLECGLAPGNQRNASVAPVGPEKELAAPSNLCDIRE